MQWVAPVGFAVIHVDPPQACLVVTQCLEAQGARLDSLLGRVLALAPVAGSHVAVEAFGRAVGAAAGLLAVAVWHAAKVPELALVRRMLAAAGRGSSGPPETC